MAKAMDCQNNDTYRECICIMRNFIIRTLLHIGVIKKRRDEIGMKLHTVLRRKISKEVSSMDTYTQMGG